LYAMVDSSRVASPSTRTLRPGPHVVSRQIGAGAVLIHLRTNQIYELNTQGARVWQLIQDGMTRDEIVATLTGEFDAGQANLAGDVDALLARLTEAELVLA
jgi:hypothetical protein